MVRRHDIKKHVRVAKAYVFDHVLWKHTGEQSAFSDQTRMLLAFAACMALLLACIVASPAWAADAAQESSQSSAQAPVQDGTQGATEGESGLLNSDENSVNARQTADNSFLYDTSIYELSQADATYQGNTVQVVGEVVGDSIRSEEDPGKSWITLEAIEEEYESSISVLVDDDTVGLIDTYGGYNAQGTTLQVRGTFYLACPSHEGITDIHAENVVLVARGSTTTDEFKLADFKVGAILVAVGLLLTLVYRYLRERER